MFTVKLVRQKIFWLVVFSFLSGCQSSDLSQPTVRIGYLPVVHGLPLYVALEEKYFETAGIKIRAIPFQAPNQIIDALLGGRIDFGASATTALGITAITHLKRPDGLKVFSVGGNDSNMINDFLLVHRESQIKTVEDLAGKTIGVLPGIQWQTIATHFLLGVGLDPQNVRIVGLGPGVAVQALASRQVDALFYIEPARAVAMKMGVGKDLLLSPAVHFVAEPFYAGAGVVSTSFLKTQPDLAQRVIAIFHQAAVRIRAEPEKVKNYLVKYTALSPDLVNTIDLPIIKSYFELTQADQNAIQQFVDIFETHGVVNQPISVREIIIGRSSEK